MTSDGAITYFNGFMSGDGLGSIVHAKTRFLLVELQARVAKNYACGHMAEIIKLLAAREAVASPAPGFV